MIQKLMVLLGSEEFTFFLFFLNRSGSAVLSFSEFHGYKTSYIILVSTRVFFVGFFFELVDPQHFQQKYRQNCIRSLQKHGYCCLACPQLSSLGLQKRSRICKPQVENLHHIAGFILGARFFSWKFWFYSNIPLLGCFFLLSASLLRSNPSPAFLPSHCHDAAFIPGRITEAFPPPRSIHASQHRVYPRLPIA